LARVVHFGVLGQKTADGHAGVSGKGNGNGVYGRSKNVNGVAGYSSSSSNNGVVGVNLNGGTGVLGHSQTGIGVFGLSETWEAIHAETKSATASTIMAYNFNSEGTGSAIFGKKKEMQDLRGISRATSGYPKRYRSGLTSS
jgi:hypothetical protein